MSELATATAKLSAIQKVAAAALRQEKPLYFHPDEVAHYFTGALACLDLLQRELPSLYGDFQRFPVAARVEMAQFSDRPPVPNHYSREQLARLIRDIEQILEIRAANDTAVGAKLAAPEKLTLRWLMDHVPARSWATAVGVVAGIMASAFIAGYKGSNVPAVRDVMRAIGLEHAPAEKPSK